MGCGNHERSIETMSLEGFRDNVLVEQKPGKVNSAIYKRGGFLGFLEEATVFGGAGSYRNKWPW